MDGCCFCCLICGSPRPFLFGTYLNLLIYWMLEAVCICVMRLVV